MFSMVYNKAAFDSDLEASRDFTDMIVNLGERIRMDLSDTLRKLDLPSEILYVGSTNPSRLTTVVDPRTPDARYPCDFDIVAIPSREVDPVRIPEFLRNLLPDGQVEFKYGRYEASSYREKFPVSVSILPENVAESFAPVLYTRKHAHFDAEQIRNIRALRLFAMRNGVYGGYTQGLKGIALEQLIAQHGDFDQTLNWLFEEIVSKKDSFEVASPLDGSNLVKAVQPDILHRLKKASSTYLGAGELKSSPYTIESWQLDHPDSLNFGIGSAGDPYEVYKSVRTLLREVASGSDSPSNPKRDHRVLVIPCYRMNNVLVSVGNLLPNQVNDFRRRFVALWDSKNGGLSEKD